MESPRQRDRWVAIAGMLASLPAWNASCHAFERRRCSSRWRTPRVGHTSAVFELFAMPVPGIASGGGTKAAIEGRANELRQIMTTTFEYEREKGEERLACVLSWGSSGDRMNSRTHHDESSLLGRDNRPSTRHARDT